jgi:hypothetical protein
MYYKYVLVVATMRVSTVLDQKFVFNPTFIPKNALFNPILYSVDSS